MKFFLCISEFIDNVNERIGQSVKWLILAAVIVSTTNAIVRKLFNVSSNGWLELQWYLFGAVFMLASAYTFLKNEHIRIDIVTSNFSKRTRDWIDVFGHIIFLFPFTFLMIYHGFPFFWLSFTTSEVSANAGGLTLWPAKILLPLGFMLIFAQGISELIKRVAILRGDIEDASAGAGHHGALAETEINEAMLVKNSDATSIGSSN